MRHNVHRYNLVFKNTQLVAKLDTDDRPRHSCGISTPELKQENCVLSCSVTQLNEIKKGLVDSNLVSGFIHTYYYL